MSIVPVPAQPDSNRSARRARTLLAVSLLISGLLLGLVAGALGREPLERAFRKGAPASAGAPATQAAADTPTIYYCPMHPSYRSDRPGDCPICNMKLIPLQPGGEMGDAAGVEGHATVTITPQRRQLIGVQSALVERRVATRTIRAAARVEYDERKLSAVSLRVGGWIEELYVQSTGQSVAAGEPLLSLYSPELYEAQRSYLIARSAFADGPAQRSGESSSLGGEIGASARQRLLLLGLTEEQVRELESQGEAGPLVTFRSRSSGVVTRREAVAGARVEPGTTLYELADLSSVWILADVYETEIPALRTGAEASIELTSLPGAAFSGRIAYIYPSVDETTRTARVRVEADNADGRLKPGMYGTLSIGVDLGQQLVIDDDAVLDTGMRKLVFVDLGAGRFEPREVTLVHRGGGQAIVSAGLKEGERVITSGNFLVDSESRLRAAISQHAGSGHEHH
jgi:multidrug efflux pump subunit AcrA (membrane-fusion protein)